MITEKVAHCCEGRAPGRENGIVCVRGLALFPLLEHTGCKSVRFTLCACHVHPPAPEPQKVTQV